MFSFPWNIYIYILCFSLSLCILLLSSSSLLPNMSDLELCILTIQQTFVYRVPTVHVSGGPQCGMWGLEKPIWTGTVKVYEKGSVVYLKFLTHDHQLFCQSVEVPIAKLDFATLAPLLEAATDSSRYFVVRVMVRMVDFSLISCLFPSFVYILVVEGFFFLSFSPLPFFFFSLLSSLHYFPLIPNLRTPRPRLSCLLDLDLSTALRLSICLLPLRIR